MTNIITNAGDSEMPPKRTGFNTIRNGNLDPRTVTVDKYASIASNGLIDELLGSVCHLVEELRGDAIRARWWGTSDYSVNTTVKTRQNALGEEADEILFFCIRYVESEIPKDIWESRFDRKGLLLVTYADTIFVL